MLKYWKKKLFHKITKMKKTNKRDLIDNADLLLLSLYINGKIVIIFQSLFVGYVNKTLTERQLKSCVYFYLQNSSKLLCCAQLHPN